MHKHTLPLLLMAALALFGCSQEDSGAAAPDPIADSGDDPEPDVAPAPDPNPAPSPAPEPDPEPTPSPDVGDPSELEIQAVSLTTADDKQIAGVFTHSPNAIDAPGVLLLHQFGGTKAQWADLTPRLVMAGYAVLAIDLRGHGESDAQNGASTSIFTDPDQAPLDLRAAVTFLKNSEIVDADRIGVVGTSVGANLAVVADALDLGVVTVIALSPRLSAVSALSGSPPEIQPGNISCVAGERDSNGAQAETCRTLTQDATGQTRLSILPDTSAHGASILSAFPEENDAILDWLAQTL